ncbi:MAG: VOC family protein [Anaerolineae bacterium]|nr:VOC family protein [Anaerolineae bacterium]
MQPQIALITILTEDIARLVRFYRDVLGFQPQGEVNETEQKYVEFEHTGVRFAICARPVMWEATRHADFKQPATGQAFELAFPCESPDAVDAAYERIMGQGAAPVQAPATMPWGQRTAFFADPDGNIHELFADLPKS